MVVVVVVVVVVAVVVVVVVAVVVVIIGAETVDYLDIGLSGSVLYVRFRFIFYFTCSINQIECDKLYNVM